MTRLPRWPARWQTHSDRQPVVATSAPPPGGAGEIRGHLGRQRAFSVSKSPVVLKKSKNSRLGTAHKNSLASQMTRPAANSQRYATGAPPLGGAGKIRRHLGRQRAFSVSKSPIMLKKSKNSRLGVVHKNAHPGPGFQRNPLHATKDCFLVVDNWRNARPSRHGARLQFSKKSSYVEQL